MDKPHIDYFNMGQWPVYVGFTTSKKAFCKEMKRLKIDCDVPFFSSAWAHATTHFLEKNGERTTIITMSPRGKRYHSQYAALVAHEAMHVVQDMHMRFNQGNPFGDEADAYLVQHIVQNCLQIAFKENVEKCVEP